MCVWVDLPVRKLLSAYSSLWFMWQDFRPRCHWLDSSWRSVQKRSPKLRGSPRGTCLFVHGSPQLWSLEAKKKHLPEVACSSTSMLLYPHTTTTEHHTLQSAQKTQIFLQSKSLTHHTHRPPTVQSIHTAAHKIGKQFLDLRRANLTQQQQQNLNILKSYIYLTD